MGGFEVSGRVSGRVFENGVSGARHLDLTATRHLVKKLNVVSMLAVWSGVSGIWCLVPKVSLSVWGGFLRNPQTRHSGQMEQKG